MKKYLQKALSKFDKISFEDLQRLMDRAHSENAMLQALLNSLPFGIAVCGQNHRILFANKALYRLLNIRARGFGQPFWQLVSHEGAAHFFEAAMRAGAHEGSADFIIEGRTLSCSATPFASQGRIDGNVIQAQDVTEERQRMSRLRQTESLARISKMAAAVAHEIKNPLGAMSIHLQLLKRSFEGPNWREEAASCIDVLQEELDNLNRVASSYLMAARPMDLALIKADVAQTVKETIAFIEPELERQNIKIALKLAPGSLFWAFIDPAGIRQALINLMRNAAAAIGQSGGLLSVSLEEKSRWLELSVTDNGSGIPEAIAPQIFQPYFTTKKEGNGLGLTIVFKIISEHGGDIKAASPPPGQKRGAQFIIRLPAAEAVFPLLDAPPS